MSVLLQKRVLTDYQEQYYGSMLGQDAWVIEDVYNLKRNGFFVDVGATDGVVINNTVALEDEFGWTGICVEPSSYFSELEKNRSSCRLCNLAVTDKTGQKVKFQQDEVYAMGAISGIVQYLDTHAPTGPVYDVETISLTDLLIEFDAPKFIEYLSLDTEGSEYIILKDFDYGQYTFGAITVEHNNVFEKRYKIRKLLEKHGYIWKQQLKEDDCYIHESVNNA